MKQETETFVKLVYLFLKMNTMTILVCPLYGDMVTYFCHHLSDNYVDLSDLYVVLSNLYVDLSDLLC